MLSFIETDFFCTDCSATDLSMIIFPALSGGVDNAASSSAPSAFLISPAQLHTICSTASSVIWISKLPSPFFLSERARIIPFFISSSFSALSSKMRHLLTIALVIERFGFSVVEPTNIMLPSSIADSTQSDCALFQRWHSSSNKYVFFP